MVQRIATRRLLSAFAICLLYSVTALALQPQIRFERISVEQGLSHPQVTAITQDQSGFMWIGTADGLNRYDGYEFSVYKNDKALRTSLSDSEIRSIIEDHVGNLWIGTKFGLNRMIRGQDSFVRYLHDPAVTTSIGSDEINDIFVDHEGVVWVGTPAGLDRYEPASDSFTRFQYDHDNLVDGVKQGPVVDIYEDSRNDLYIATRAATYGSLSRFDRATQTFEPLYGCPMEEHGDCTMAQSDTSHRAIGTNINGLFRDSTGAFWMSTGWGVIKQTVDGYLQRYDHHPDDNNILNATISNDQVLAPIEDLDGTLWFATRRGLNKKGPDKLVIWTDVEGTNGGLQLPDYPAWTSIFDRFEHDPADPYSLSSDMLSAIFVDRFGVIWVGTMDAGLNKFHPQGMKFGHYKHEPSDPQSLTDNLVSAVSSGENGDLWFATLGGGLNRVNIREGTNKHYRHDPERPNSLPSASIHALRFDSEGELWVGTYSGLSRFNKADETFENLNIFPFGTTILPVLSIMEQPAGVLWLGTTGMIARYDTISGDIEYIRPNTQAEPALVESTYGPIVADSNNMLWIATDNAGVHSFELERAELRNYYHEPGNPASISDNRVTTILPGQKGVMWFGTRKGLDKLDTGDGTFTHYTTDDGLPADYIVDLKPDNRGNLWIATDAAGLSRFDPISETFENFDVYDGLQGNRFFHIEVQYPSSNLIFAGKYGINIVDPSNFIKRNDQSAMAITEVVAFGSSTPGINPGEIRMVKGDGEFSFKFSSLNYANPPSTEYAYMLEGHDENWTYTNANERVARYAGVATGEYIFRVRAKLANNDWSESAASVNLSLVPPVWQTGWAYLTYVFLLTGLIAVFVLLREREFASQAALLERKVEDRTREVSEKEKLIRHQAHHLQELLDVQEKLYANVSHEFRTPLTLILGPVERLLRSTKDSEVKEQLGMVRSNGQRLLRLVDQLLGLARLSSEEAPTQSAQPLSRLTQHMVETFEPLARDKQIKLELGNGEDLWVECSPDALDKILLNLISNAIKYTPPGGTVTARVIARGKHEVCLSIRDTGIGISSKYHESVFDRFYRVGDIGESAPGAGLGLALVKELVESHRGSVEIESSPGNGTTVSVVLQRHMVDAKGDAAASSKPASRQIPLEVAAVTSDVSARSNGNGAGYTNGHGNGTKCLLIVEDNLQMQDYLVALLADSYHCKVASDGEEGLSDALEAVPDLVLCDVMLPKMDGFEISRALRENELTSHIPIVLLTGRGDHDSRLQGLREHVDDYMTKPFDDEELLQRIENILSARDAMRRKFSRQLFDGSEVGAEIDSKELEFLHKLQSIMERNYSDSEFRVDRMSSEMAMSDRQLQRKLKAVADHSPAEFLRNFRLKMASQQLQTGIQVGLVAEAVGFSSQAYFASCFKSEFGTTPSEYQQRFN